MSLLYTPRRPKRLRLHKSIPRGRRLRRIRPAGSMGNLYATGFGVLSWRRLEACRRLLTRQLRRSKVRVRSRLTQPLTAKSKHARMGKGKGKLRGWSGYTRPGTLMYVLEPTPRKSWLRHSSPTTRLLGKFPFGRLNYKYSGGLAAVQRSALTRLKQWNRRPRPHYPQQPQPHRLLPAHRRRISSPDREILGVNPWSPLKGTPRRCPAEGLGFWLGSGPTATAPGLLEELLRFATVAEARELLTGFLEGQRLRCLRDGGPALAGSLRLGRWLLRHRRRLRRRRQQRLLTRLLKRLPQHWRRRRRALGALLECWWRRLEEQTPRGGSKQPTGWGLVMALRSLRLLLWRLQPMLAGPALRDNPDGFLPEVGALELLPVEARENFYWPPLAEQRRESLLRRRRRLLRHRLPLTSFYPSRLPNSRLPALPTRPEKATPSQKRRWQRSCWLVNWANNYYRQQEAFPQMEETAYGGEELLRSPSLKPEESEEEELIDGWLSRSTIELLRSPLLKSVPSRKPGSGSVLDYGNQMHWATGDHSSEFTSELLRRRYPLKDSLDGLEPITSSFFSDPELSETESFQHLLPEAELSEAELAEGYSSGNYYSEEQSSEDSAPDEWLPKDRLTENYSSDDQEVMELLRRRYPLKDSLDGLEPITSSFFSDPELSETESFQHLLPEAELSEAELAEGYSSGNYYSEEQSSEDSAPDDWLPKDRLTENYSSDDQEVMELLRRRYPLKDSLDGLEPITSSFFSDPELSETESFQHLLPEAELSEAELAEAELSEAELAEGYSSGNYYSEEQSSEVELYGSDPSETDFSEDNSSVESSAEEGSDTKAAGGKPKLPSILTKYRRKRSPQVDPLRLQQERQERLQREEQERQELLTIGVSDPVGRRPSLDYRPATSGALPSVGQMRLWAGGQPGVPRHIQSKVSALQRQLARPPVAQLLEERRRSQAAAGRLACWLAGLEVAPRELQYQQWRQWFSHRGLVLEQGPEGTGALGTPEGGTLALDWLPPLLTRLLRRQRSLLRLDRRRLRRQRRLKRRQKRRRRTKARRRRFWRLTHRRRWNWWHRRQRRRDWRWSPRLNRKL